MPEVIVISDDEDEEISHFVHPAPCAPPAPPKLEFGGARTLSGLRQPQIPPVEQMSGQLVRPSSELAEPRPAKKSRANKKPPGYPKAARSAWNFFQTTWKQTDGQSVRDEPDLTAKQRAARCGQKWKSMSDVQRLPFKQLADQDKKRFAGEWTSYCQSADAAGHPAVARDESELHSGAELALAQPAHNESMPLTPGDLLDPQLVWEQAVLLSQCGPPTARQLSRPVQQAWGETRFVSLNRVPANRVGSSNSRDKLSAAEQARLEAQLAPERLQVDQTGAKVSAAWPYGLTMWKNVVRSLIRIGSSHVMVRLHGSGAYSDQQLELWLSKDAGLALPDRDQAKARACIRAAAQHIFEWWQAYK